MHCYTSQLVAVWTFMMTSHFTTDKEYRSHLILPFQNAASGCVFDMYDWPKSSSYAEKWQRFKISKVRTQEGNKKTFWFAGVQMPAGLYDSLLLGLHWQLPS